MTIRTYETDLGKRKDEKVYRLEGRKTWKTETQTPYEGLTYDVSVKGIKLRMNPENFLSPKNFKSSKYKLGLHDLSASLLNPNRKISDKQTYNNLKNSDSHGLKAVFMPLPRQEDLELFHMLNSVSKKYPDQIEFYNLIRGYRSKMTRLKQAYERDLASGCFVLNPDNTVNPKFRRGIGGTLKISSDKSRTFETDKERNKEITILKDKAVFYKDILPRSTREKAVNEIIISYRHHGNTNFPIIATWDLTKKQFERISPADEKTVKIIKDKPKRN